LGIPGHAGLQTQEAYVRNHATMNARVPLDQFKSVSGSPAMSVDGVEHHIALVGEWKEIDRDSGPF
jgi:hypothetical protein